MRFEILSQFLTRHAFQPISRFGTLKCPTTFCQLNREAIQWEKKTPHRMRYPLKMNKMKLTSNRLMTIKKKKISKCTNRMCDIFFSSKIYRNKFLIVKRTFLWPKKKRFQISTNATIILH